MFEKIKELDLQALKYMRFGLIALVVVDMIGVWWYLELKKLAMALMIVLIIALGFVLFLQNQKMPPEEPKNNKEEKNKEETSLIPDLGLPSIGEYENNLKIAVGT